ncbi:MAG: hypothetical protein S4CHLAM102_02170 [Chlamydiia bacterium]|nr:hypothetical protein [Chlamydiia bacterium]
MEEEEITVMHVTQEARVIGVTTLIQLPQKLAAKDLNLLWIEFFAAKVDKLLTNYSDEMIYLLYTEIQVDPNNPDGVQAQATIGYKVDDSQKVPEGLSEAFLPPFDYAQFTTKGPHPESIGELWSIIEESGLPRAFVADLELYPTDSFHGDAPEVALLVSVDVDKLDPVEESGREE